MAIRSDSIHERGAPDSIRFDARPGVARRHRFGSIVSAPAADSILFVGESLARPVQFISARDARDSADSIRFDSARGAAEPIRFDSQRGAAQPMRFDSIPET